MREGSGFGLKMGIFSQQKSEIPCSTSLFLLSTTALFSLHHYNIIRKFTIRTAISDRLTGKFYVLVSISYYVLEGIS
jgi:hypothetical protein